MSFKKHRKGEKYITNQGYEIEIIEYINNTNSTVRFEDGTIKENLEFRNIFRGAVSYPVKSKIGEKYTTNEGYKLEIIAYEGCHNISVLLDDSIRIDSVNYQAIKKGQVANPMHKAFSHVGFRGVGIHKLSIKDVHTKCGKTWARMLERCYNDKVQKKYPSYIGCSVTEEWYNFQVFAEWFYENYNEETMQGWHLDKDILFKGNKIYSPETCCFVHRDLNTLFTKSNKIRGKYPIGVSKRWNKYRALLKNKILGIFNTPEEAFYAYKEAKECYIKEVADKYKGQITEKVYQAMYNYQVEITD